MKREILSIIFAIICAVCFCVSPAQAETITIAIEAVVDRVDDRSSYLEGKIKTGDIITGTYTYDSSTPDTAPEYWLGKYEYSQAPYGMILEVGGFRFETDPEGVDFNIYVSNDRISPVGDIFTVISNKNLALSNDVNIRQMYWQLNDRSGQALSNTSLPLTAPVLGDWQDGNRLHVEGVPRQTDFFIDAHVISAIPEPATMILLGLGALMLIRRIKR